MRPGQELLVDSPLFIEFDRDVRTGNGSVRRFVVDRDKVILEPALAPHRFQLIGLCDLAQLGTSELNAHVFATDAAAFLVPADKAAWRTLRHWLDLPDILRNDSETNWPVGVDVSGFQKCKRQETVSHYKKNCAKPKGDQKRLVDALHVLRFRLIFADSFQSIAMVGIPYYTVVERAKNVPNRMAEQQKDQRCFACVSDRMSSAIAGHPVCPSGKANIRLHHHSEAIIDHADHKIVQLLCRQTG